MTSLIDPCQIEYLIGSCSYDNAYKLIMDARKIDPQRKEVLQSLINIHMPNTNLNSVSNPYANDKKAKEFTIKLETLYPNDPSCLYIAGETYNILGLYNDSLRALKKAFVIIVKQNNNDDMAEQIKKKITDTYVDRYSNCPNNSHEIIIKYLIELIEWKYNDFTASNLQICIEEIWERMEYCLNNANTWNKIHETLTFIPCSIPLSINVLNIIYNIFNLNKQYYFGIEFFTRLLTEYQTYNTNMLTLHAKFAKYYVLYLNRAKLYQILQKNDEMNQDIQYCNAIYNSSQKVTVENLSKYIINEPNEKPIIETPQQIKKRRASRLSISNISISPMPKQYRDLHLTPKSQKNIKQSNQNKLKYKRYSMNNIDRMSVYEKKEQENGHYQKYDDRFRKLQNENKLLENKVVDLKNDLHRVTSENGQYKNASKNEIEKLQEQVIKLTDRLCASNTADGGEKQSNTKIISKVQYANQVNPEIIESLNRQIKSLKRQLKIVKDCKIKNNAQLQMKPKKLSGSICGCIGKLMKLLVGLFIFVSLLILCYAWMGNIDFLTFYIDFMFWIDGLY